MTWSVPKNIYMDRGKKHKIIFFFFYLNLFSPTTTVHLPTPIHTHTQTYSEKTLLDHEQIKGRV